MFLLQAQVNYISQLQAKFNDLQRYAVTTEEVNEMELMCIKILWSKKKTMAGTLLHVAFLYVWFLVPADLTSLLVFHQKGKILRIVLCGKATSEHNQNNDGERMIKSEQQKL